MKRLLKKYGRRKKEKTKKRETITEPPRRSIYDVLQANLKLAKRVTFIHRILYIGQHHFFHGTGDIAEAMERNFKQTNTGYCTEPLSGVLLHYDHHFCYIVEGSEEALHKHLSLLFEHEDQNIDNVRLLSTIHHVKSRFWNDWMSYHGRPSERVEEIDADSDLENSMRYATECCEKLYRFANAFIKDQLKVRAMLEGTYDEDEDEDYEPPQPVKQRSRSLVERDQYSHNLPELKLLNFLIHCQFFKTLKQYHHYYEFIGQSHDYNLKNWPTPKNFIPYDIFDERYDPITDLPPLPGTEKGDEDTEYDTVSALTNITAT